MPSTFCQQPKKIPLELRQKFISKNVKPQTFPRAQRLQFLHPFCLYLSKIRKCCARSTEKKYKIIKYLKKLSSKKTPSGHVLADLKAVAEKFIGSQEEKLLSKSKKFHSFDKKK